MNPEVTPPRAGRKIPFAKILRSVCFSISITGLAGIYPQCAAQEVTSQAPPAQTLPDAPNPESAKGYPEAVEVPGPDQGTLVTIESDQPQKYEAGVYTLNGNVLITYGNRSLRADHIEYDSNTGEVTLSGHVILTGGENDERIEASHGAFNIRTETGRFYDVSGSVGQNLRRSGVAPRETRRAVYANGNPFLFSGRMVVKTGPQDYEIYGGTVTSCQLPRPDWLLSSGYFAVRDSKATAKNTVFHLRGLPLFWLPYATHSVDANNRQSGLLIPELGFNSASKGNTVGEQIYWAINRSMDLTVGTIYYSARGWEQTASFRYRGLGQDFTRASYSALQDRGYYPGGVYVNQSGTDLLFSGRHDLEHGDEVTGHQAMLVGDVEYLSSFAYREAFSTNYNQAVSSDVISTMYATHEWDGMAASLEADRYQGEKRVQSQTLVNGVLQVLPEQQVRIFHAPSLEFTTTDHRLGGTMLEWNVDSSATGLKRSQPNFTTSGLVERVDVRPELALPFGGAGWRVRPSIAGRETFYSRSKLPTVPGKAPVESSSNLSRSDVDVRVEVRPPTLERTFNSGWVRSLFRTDVRHTIEPDFIYRYTGGLGNFSHVPRFDTTDVASDTDEMEYGLTQRLFLRRRANEPCSTAGEAADASEILESAGQQGETVTDPGLTTGAMQTAAPVCGSKQWITWRLAQKFFFDPHFGGAVVTGPRNVLQTTLDLSGISFLTRPRNLSPLVSRLRLRTSDKVDLEWDFDFDFCAAQTGSAARLFPNECSRKFTSNNLYLDVHEGNVFAGVGYARLNAPGRSYVEGTPSTIAEFDQARVLMGYGKPTRPGFSTAAYAGIDLDLGTVQYGAVQTSYNWNCCGVSVEYRKYELGTARNDNGYRFNFTLANIGSAGNLRHAQQIF